MAFADLTANLNLNIANFSSRLSQASRQMSRFANNMQHSYGEAANALNKHNLQLKDTVRIVHGIVIAQTFYQAAGAITDATRSLWDFNVALDYMHVTYSALFGDTKVASDFMSVLKEHSVETIFDYQQLADASKKLLAYGIEYENLMFIMEGLTNLGAMSGDSAALDRIALALGQIYTKGKLSAEEMRQLANAYIPITEILQDKFGLTGDDLKRVGDLNLPASEVINAIVDYANENFGSVGDAAMYTITGLQNKIVDTLKVVGSEMLKPITTAYKSFLAYIADGLENIRAEFEADGVRGIFEYLVPDKQTQQTIKQFIANVRNLFMSLVSVGAVVGQVFGNFASVFVTAFNIVSPIIVGFVNVLAGLLNAILSTRTGATLLRVALVAAAGAFIVLRVQAMAALVVTAVTKAVINLAKALMLLATLITRHPILSLLAGLAIALVGVSAASSGANSAIGGLFDTISEAIGGSNSGDVFDGIHEGIEGAEDALDQFDDRLGDGAEGAEGLEDALNGAGGAADKLGKKTGGLLSFDEVFKLPDQSDASGGSGGGSGIGDGILDDIANLGAGLGGLGDALIPDIPDFSTYISDFVDGLFGGLETGIFDALASTGLGAIIGGGLGAIIGGLLGGVPGAILGAKIGAFAGGFVGWLWDALDGAISNTIVGALSGIASVLSGAFSKTFGTSLLNAFTSLFKGGSITSLFSSLGTAIKNTGLKSIAKGGLIGAAIGLVVDGLAHLLWNTLDDKFAGADAETAKVGQTIGSILGTIIGGLLGGPPGAIIGSAIGTFAGGFVGLFWTPIKEYFDPKNNVLSAFFVQVGSDIAAWATTTVTSLSNWWNDTWSGFSTWWSDTTSGFSNWWEDTTTGFGTWLADTIAIFSDWDSINSETLSNWWSNTKEGFNSWDVETAERLRGWWSETTSGFAKWFLETDAGLAAWRADTGAMITGWAMDALASLLQWMEDTRDKFITWVANVTAKFEEWDEAIGTVLAGFVKASVLALTQGMQNMYNAIATKLAAIKSDWIAKWDEIKTKFGTWWKDMKTSMDTWLDDYVWKPIADFFNLDKFWNRIKDLLEAIKKKFKEWWKSIGGIFTTDDIDPPPSDQKPTNRTGATSRASLIGHYAGGVFNREHVARFAEGNKAEAIIPLENAAAMQPFVDAVSDGIVGTLAPIVAQINANNANALPPMYVGTLIADERGLRQLYKKMEVIQMQESNRRGTPSPMGV